MRRFLPFLTLLPLPAAALAQNPALDAIREGVRSTAAEATLVTSEEGGNIYIIIGQLISVLIGLFGIIFLGITVYAGVMYITSGGDPKKVEDAKKMLTWSAIGMALILASFAISRFLLGALSAVIGAV